MPRPPSPFRHWPAAGLGLLAAAVAVWARHRIFPDLSWNRDEPVYLWHMDLLRAGRLTAPDGGHPDLFLPWLSGHADGQMFTQYTLGWPLVLLASSVLTGSTATALGFGAALAVIGSYAFAWELTRERRVAVGTAAVMVASPILPIQGGVHLSYLFTLGLGLLCGTLLLSGLRVRRMGRVVCSGALLGWVLFTRPYDAVLWAVAFGAYVLVVHRGAWRDLLRPLIAFSAGAGPLLVATLLYNRHITGSLLEFPIVAVDPRDGFGFGPRRLMPEFPVVDYSPYDGLRALVKHGFFLPWFLAGSYVGVVLGLIGLWLGRRQRATLAMLLVALVFPLGYLPFWGTHVSSDFTRLSGPIYYVPLFTCAAFLIANVLNHVHLRRPRAAAGLVALMVLATVPTARSRLMINHELSTAQRAWIDSVEAIDGPALVFVGDSEHYLLYGNPFSVNDPDLDDRVLYAVDAGPEMLDLIAEHPERTPYLQLASVATDDRGPKEDPAPYDVDVTPIRVLQSSAFTVGLTIGDPGGAAVVSVELRAGGNTYRMTVPAGSPLPSPRVGPAGRGPVDLELPERGTLSIRVGFGRDEADALAHPVGREDMPFRTVSGTIEVLQPSAKLVQVRVGDTRQWRRTPDLVDLRVDLTPRAAEQETAAP